LRIPRFGWFWLAMGLEVSTDQGWLEMIELARLRAQFA
jgi:hypothetical protein